MYDAVKGHEMKHVHTEENVLASHVGRLRAALEETGRNQTVFGPGYSGDVNGRYNAFLKQVDTTIQDEVDVYNYDEAKAQRAVDTLQEYQRIANLCADQLKAMQ